MLSSSEAWKRHSLSIDSSEPSVKVSTNVHFASLKCSVDVLIACHKETIFHYSRFYYSLSIIISIIAPL